MGRAAFLGRTHLELLLFIHLAEREEMLDEEHEVDAGKSGEPLPHRVQAAIVLIMGFNPVVGVVMTFLGLREGKPISQTSQTLYLLSKCFYPKNFKSASPWSHWG